MLRHDMRHDAVDAAAPAGLERVAAGARGVVGKPAPRPDVFRPRAAAVAVYARATGFWDEDPNGPRENRVITAVLRDLAAPT